MSELDAPIRGLKPMMLVATVAAFALAIVGSFNRGPVGTTAAGLAVAMMVAAPLVRVLVVGAHWWRIGDRRFALVAICLLAIVGSGALIALL